MNKCSHNHPRRHDNRLRTYLISAALWVSLEIVGALIDGSIEFLLRAGGGPLC